MIKSLEVHNFALLDHVSVKFQSGLIILTGETGAGKSIFIDAMGAILGEKVDQTVVRFGADKAVVEAVFSTDESYEVQALLKELDLWDDSGDLILRREILKSGRTRSFVNDTPVTLNILIQIGDYLVDLHGQHEHQSLLKVNEHLKFLDQFGKLIELGKTVTALFQQINNLKQKLSELKIREAQLKTQKELFEFQLEEINQINPQVDEEEELLKEEKILHNGEKIFRLTNSIYKNLYEDAGSVYDRLSETSDQLGELSQIDDRLTAVNQEIESARIVVDETAKFLQNYIAAFDFNPDRLEEIRQRLAELSGLKKKFGGTIEAVIQQRERLAQELEAIGSLDSQIAAVQQELTVYQKSYTAQAIELSQKRQAAAQTLKKLIEKNLSELGMAQAVLDIQITQEKVDTGFVHLNGHFLKASKTGIDAVEFFLAANPGSPPQPLIKVASGGEISRVMLALKLAQADTDRLPVMIFDEIDSGVSGRIAQAVGRNLRKLSELHQIICITHLPQIASMATDHLLVEKQSDTQTTRTTIRRLNAEDRVLAIATLLGGEKISETHLESARELMNEI